MVYHGLPQPISQELVWNYRSQSTFMLQHAEHFTPFLRETIWLPNLQTRSFVRQKYEKSSEHLRILSQVFLTDI